MDRTGNHTWTNNIQQILTRDHLNTMEALQKIVEGLDENLQKINKEMQRYEHVWTASPSPLKNRRRRRETPAATHTEVSIFSMIVPLVESIISFFSKIVRGPSQASMIRTLQTGLSELTSAQQRLKEQERDIQNKLMDKQLQLAKYIYIFFFCAIKSVLHTGEWACTNHL